MAYQAGTATSAAMSVAGAAGPAGIYIVAAAAVVDIYASITAQDESEKLAQQKRDNMVLQQSYQNTASNAQLQARQEQTTREDFEAQLRALETTSKVENTDRSVSSAGFSRVAEKYTRRFNDVIESNESNMRALEVEHRMRGKSGQIGMEDRINSIPVYKADVAGTLVNTGLTIYGMKQEQKRQNEETEKKLGGAGAQTVPT